MNRLQQEKSPYLLQHADNPVDWYPWGDEAFKKATQEDKPVFLSIGYATCHWCHVMAHESFEDEQVASLLNSAFVNIKVDREERPDIDNTYMTICQMLTGQGGWPLTIIMTPKKEPFFAATYLPKESRQNRIGMLDLVPQIETIWNSDRERILQSADKIKSGFTKSLDLGKSTGPLSEDILRKTTESLSNRFDPVSGGFGTSPKFPSPHNLLYLLNSSRISGDAESKKMALLTLEKMRLGGIWDHIGKGFHRYSTDHEWLLPHFEKMLYDQAMMLMAYTEGWRISENPLFKKTACDIVDYLDECLRAPGGAFYSAEDADSEGEEGKFYVWKKSEIESVLTDENAELFCKLFQINSEGNFYDESTRQKTGANIPHLKNPVSKDLEEHIEDILSQLHQHRKNRIRPQLDDKILTDWNGLLIAALARAGRILEEPGFTERAETAWAVLNDKCLQKSGGLFHRLKDGEAAIPGMADDYAFTIFGLIELYQSAFKPEYLSLAIEIQDYFDRNFQESQYGGYFFTSEESDELLGRQKEIYDGAIPSSNSVAAYNTYHLSRLTGDTSHEKNAQNIFNAFSEQINDGPAGYTFALNAWQIIQSDGMEIVITAEETNQIVQEFIQVCRHHAPPGSTILLKTKETALELSRLSSFSKNYTIRKDPAVFVCMNFTCKAPVYNNEELLKSLGAH